MAAMLAEVQSSGIRTHCLSMTPWSLPTSTGVGSLGRLQTLVSGFQAELSREKSLLLLVPSSFGATRPNISVESAASTKIDDVLLMVSVEI